MPYRKPFDEVLCSLLSRQWDNGKVVGGKLQHHHLIREKSNSSLST